MGFIVVKCRDGNGKTPVSGQIFQPVTWNAVFPFSHQDPPCWCSAIRSFHVVPLRLGQDQWLMGVCSSTLPPDGARTLEGDRVVTEDSSVFEMWLTGASTSAPSHKNRPGVWISSCAHALCLVPFLFLTLTLEPASVNRPLEEMMLSRASLLTCFFWKGMQYTGVLCYQKSCPENH